MSTPVTLVGRLGGDPDLRFMPDGSAVANFSVVTARRVKKGDVWEDADTTWWRVNAWGEMAERAQNCLRKGDAVIVVGNSYTRTYEKDGVGHQSLEVRADAIGPNLRWVEAHVNKPQRSSGRQSGSQDPGRSPGGAPSAPAEADPWASGPAPW